MSQSGKVLAKCTGGDNMNTLYQESCFEFMKLWWTDENRYLFSLVIILLEKDLKEMLSLSK